MLTSSNKSKVNNSKSLDEKENHCQKPNPLF